MLMRQLGYEPPTDTEFAEIRSKVASRRTPEPRGLIPAAVLGGDPLVSYSGILEHAPLG